jgi:hypothetical protein
MRLSVAALVAIGAVAALVALGVTDRILPATDPRTADVRPWVAARAMGVTAYLLLAAQVGTGLLLSHPRNTAAWQLSRPVFPWHELLTVFTGTFLVLHVALLALDPYAKVGVVGALVPGLSEYRPAAIAVGSVAVYALLFTALTAKWTRLLPPGWWLRVHRFAALTFLLAWMHAVLAGTDTGALSPIYLATGLPIMGGVAHRWWTVRSRPQPAAVSTAAPSTSAIGRQRPVAAVLEESR